MRIRVLFDNVPGDARLETSWGYSALVETEGGRLLFDTGADGPILLGNMKALGIEPAGIEEVAISHGDWDHTGGLAALLEAGARPRLFLPPCLVETVGRETAGRAEIVAAEPGMEIIKGIFSTGEMIAPADPKKRIEQSLILDTGEGIVVLTGCAHPGIVAIAERALELRGGPLLMVMGGFHLLHDDSETIKSVVGRLRQLGLKRAAPSHCTGDEAMAVFAREFGDDFLAAGLGLSVEI